VRHFPAGSPTEKTYKEALANVEIIIQEWIESTKELGRPIPLRAATRRKDTPLITHQRNRTEWDTYLPN